MFLSKAATGNNSNVMSTYPAQCRPRSTLECGARRACSRSAIFNFALHQEQASCPEGSEHRASCLRMAPEGPVAPSGPPRPDLNSRGLSEQFRSRARLRRLLVRLRRPTLQRSLRSLRQGGFALYVRLRHYRSSLFCCRKIIPSHSFAALAALIVRRVKGDVALLMRRVNDLGRPTRACRCQMPHAPRRGIGVRTRQRHLAAPRQRRTLPPAYFPVFGGATLAPGRSDGASRICRGSLSPANISVSRR